MNRGEYNFRGDVGVTFYKRLTFKEDGALINLSGYSARMQIRTAPESPDALATLTDSDGITLGGSAGTVELLIPADTMADLEPGDYAYDILLTHSGIVDKFLSGRFRVDATVTRA